MSDRARQFMPFSALKGFDELIREKHHIVVAKKELSEDDATELSKKLSAVKKGMMVEVTYFLCGEYIKVEGIVTGVDFTFKNLTVVKKKISFDDILSIDELTK